jgi:cell division protein FtsL
MRSDGITRRRNSSAILLGSLVLVGALSFWGIRRLNGSGGSGSLERSPARLAQTAKPDSQQASASQNTAQILIQYKRPIPEAEKQRIRSQASVVLVRKIDTPYLQMDVVAPTSQRISALDVAVSQISKNPDVEFAEVQQKYSHEPNPN